MNAIQLQASKLTIEGIRQLKRMTRKELAEKSLVSVPTITRIERGEKARLSTLKLLADALEIPLERILDCLSKQREDG